ncbi:hypothetical protein [Oceanobacillus kapialis]|uniref:Spore coat protein YsxE n=1 Tax=Oceanobacillus kapialis TaxID=481353 RepID=A0ABW5PZG4_9BACI
METEKILQSFSVYPLNIENITTHLWKVKDGNRAYALKESKLSPHAITNWENIYKLADYHKLSAVMPVYMTRNGQLYQEHLGKFYYLSPWMEKDQNRGTPPLITDFYKNIGNIHAKTKQSRNIDKEAFIQEFSAYKQACETLFKELNRTVSRFEQMHYMSPFELMVLTQYRDLEIVFQVMAKRLNQLVYVADEEDLIWNTSICHGQLSKDHLVYSNNGTQILNWEQAHYENATMDLVRFFREESLEYDSPSSDYIEQFKGYIKENELTEKELQLMTIYLLHPFSYYRVVQEYVKNPKANSMLVATSQLQRAYRQLIFGLNWSDYVEKEHESLVLEDLDS